MIYVAFAYLILLGICLVFRKSRTAVIEVIDFKDLYEGLFSGKSPRWYEWFLIPVIILIYLLLVLFYLVIVPFFGLFILFSKHNNQTSMHTDHSRFADFEKAPEFTPSREPIPISVKTSDPSATVPIDEFPYSYNKRSDQSLKNDWM